MSSRTMVFVTVSSENIFVNLSHAEGSNYPILAREAAWNPETQCWVMLNPASAEDVTRVWQAFTFIGFTVFVADLREVVLSAAGTQETA